MNQAAAYKIKETQLEQKWFQRLWTAITIPAFALTGFDFRFGWTRGLLGEVPLILVLTARQWWSAAPGGCFGS